MKELLFSMASGLVDHPEQLQIREEGDNGVVNLILFVHPEDMGKVIGKQGRIANSLRQVLKACAIKESVKVNLQIEANEL